MTSNAVGLIAETFWCNHCLPSISTLSPDDIKPGETGTGTLDLKLGAISQSDKDGSLTLWPAKYKIVLDIDDRAAWDFEITGDQVVLEKLPPKRS